MGKRSAVVELFLGDMGSMQRELRPSILREDQLTMETKLEQIAVKAVNQLPKSVDRGRATASGDQVGDENFSSLPRPSRHVRFSAACGDQADIQSAKYERLRFISTRPRLVT
jgi:hypothetical protein